MSYHLVLMVEAVVAILGEYVTGRGGDQTTGIPL